MNKAELITALAEHMDGDRRAAGAAVDGLLDVIVRTVRAGDSVSLTGFGVFEQRQRAARSGRNPRTGQAIQVPPTVVPAFRPGALFRDVVSGAREPGQARARPVRSVRSAGRPLGRSVASAVEGASGNGTAAGADAPVAVEERPAKASGKASATSATSATKPGKAGKDVKAGKAGKGEKSAKDGAKGGKGAKAAGKGGKKKGRK